MKTPYILTSGLLAASLVAGVATAHQQEGQADSERDRGAGMGWAHMLEMMDSNKNGTLEQDEMEAHHRDRFKMLDLDGDGSVTAEEAKAAHEKMRSQGRAERAAKAFDGIDANGDGMISREEFLAHIAEGPMRDGMGERMRKHHRN